MWPSCKATHLADATALPLYAAALLVVLVNLVREEGVKDLVDQLGGGGFGGALAVLLNLGGVTDGLPSGGSPGKEEKQRVSVSTLSHTVSNENTTSTWRKNREPCGFG